MNPFSGYPLSCDYRPFGNCNLIDLIEKDWVRIREQSERAAGLFSGLLLMGLDVLLDLDSSGNIIPVFLEANPRLAGLSHSRLLSEDIMSSSQNGVSLKLWHGLGQYYADTGLKKDQDKSIALLS